MILSVSTNEFVDTDAFDVLRIRRRKDMSHVNFNFLVESMLFEA